MCIYCRSNKLITITAIVVITIIIIVSLQATNGRYPHQHDDIQAVYRSQTDEWLAANITNNRSVAGKTFLNHATVELISRGPRTLPLLFDIMTSGDEASRACAQFTAYQILDAHINSLIEDRTGLEGQSRMQEFWSKHGNYDSDSPEHTRKDSIVLLRKWYEHEVASGSFNNK